MRISRALAVLPVALTLGCGSNHSPTPSAPSSPAAPSPLPPSPPSHPNLDGYVYDTAFRPVGGATVNLLDGAQAGASTKSNEFGRFTFTGTFEDPTTLRVSKEGYAAATGTARSNNAPSGTIWAFVVLDELARPVDITGNYTLAILADTTCADIPSDMHTRTYAASIGLTPDSRSQAGTSLTLTIVDGSFLPDHNSFPIGVAGDDVAFSIYNGEDFGLVEKIAPATFLAIEGSASLSVGSAPVTSMTAMLSGVIDYCALQSDTGWTYQCNSGPRTAYQHCESNRHQLMLTRR
jgi:hypothetical protein